MKGHRGLKILFVGKGLNLRMKVSVLLKKMSES